ncbi:MAG: hypothetical protein H0W82_02090 [Actinobacteria bacterium]|nr:hypothetical protein [Actinomycetota bacterium]
MAALHQLCTLPKLHVGRPATQDGPVPAFVRAVERVAAAHRGLEFLHEVPVEVGTDAQLDARLARIVDASISTEQLHRRTLAWRTIGVIPPDADLARALRAYYAGQVLGFYVPETGELVTTGSDAQPSLVDAVVLAHELTHALDDQHFDLVRVDRLGSHCRDELSMAALGAVEGSAQYVATEAIADLRPIADGIGDVGGGTSPEVPPFVQELQQWPYAAGTSFIRSRVKEGGTRAVDEAIRHLPVSTEQILHPQRYPNDTPQPLDAPDLSSPLGSRWRDLDVMEIGEAWLQLALSLRLDGVLLDRATPGWDGGIYRAWADGTHVAVLLRTVWDTPADADEFAAAMRAWIGEGSAPAALTQPGPAEVEVAFASDATTLESLRAAEA